MVKGGGLRRQNDSVRVVLVGRGFPTLTPGRGMRGKLEATRVMPHARYEDGLKLCARRQHTVSMATHTPFIPLPSCLCASPVMPLGLPTAK